MSDGDGEVGRSGRLREQGRLKDGEAATEKAGAAGDGAHAPRSQAGEPRRPHARGRRLRWAASALAGFAAVMVAAALYLRQVERVRPAQGLASATMLGWVAKEHGSPARYRVGEWRLELSSRESEFGESPLLTVRAPGAAPITLEGGVSWAEAGVGVGQLDGEGPPELIFTTFTGGEHCCTWIRVLQLDGGRWRLIDLGSWDGLPLSEWPTSIDGDDRPDLMLSDDSFLYAFGSEADSFPPARIFNLEGGRAIDVSTSPRYRAVHLSELARARESCGSGDNGACASYAASAARAGEFESAWRFVVQHHDANTFWRLHDGSWPVPGGCRVKVSPGACPPSGKIGFATFPEALRWFLGERGYIEPQTPSGPA